MSFNLTQWIWLFPIAFILHDFEELLLFEPWLKQNAPRILERVQGKIPAVMEKQLRNVLGKSTLQFAFPIFLIFCLTCVASLLAAQFDMYGFFLAASSLFFLHGWMHIGQAILLRRYVPALITSVLIVLPYGGLLFWRLLQAGVVNVLQLSIYCLAAIPLAVPFILGMHRVGEWLYQQAMRALID